MFCVHHNVVQALSKARDLRAEFDKREKPLSTVKELVGDSDPEIQAFATKFERVKKLTEFYLSKVVTVIIKLHTKTESKTWKTRHFVKFFLCFDFRSRLYA